MANQEREPFVLDFPNGQRVEDILKKAQNIANIQSIGDGLSLDDETGELSALGGGGTDNYNLLNNKPKVNHVELTGDKSLVDLGILFATSLIAEIDSSTYVVTLTLKDQEGNILGEPQSLDLPLESVVVGGRYDNTTKKVILTLQNGNTVEFSVADLVDGLQSELSSTNKLNPEFINYNSTHRAVSDAEKSTWNGKQDAISDLSTIRSGAALGATAVQPSDMEEALDDKQDNLTFDSTPTSGSTNPVTSGGVYTALDDKVDKVTGKVLSTNDFTNEYKSQIETNTEGIGAVANAGAKNIVNIQKPTTVTRTSYTTLTNGGVELSCNNAQWTDYAIADIVVETGKPYVIKFLLDESSGTNDFYFFLRENNSSGSNLATKNYANTTGEYVSEFTPTTNIAWLGIYLNNSATARTATAKVRCSIMPKALYDVDSTYVPYAPTNRELYEEKADKTETAAIANIGAKNVLNVTATSREVNGITFTVNDDNSVSINGTATARAQFQLAPSAPMPDLQGYILNGAVENDSGAAIEFQYSESPWTSFANDSGNGAVIGNYNNANNIAVFIDVPNGATVDNLIFKPMIRPASITDDTFVPYGMTNVELTRTKADKSEVAVIANAGSKNRLNTYLATVKPLNCASTGSWSDNVYTHNGVTFTVNDDGSVTINGMSTGSGSAFVFSRNAGTSFGGLVLTGSLSSDSGDAGISIVCRRQNDSEIGRSRNGQPFVIPTDVNVDKIVIHLVAGEKETNRTMYPMVRNTEIEDDSYQPYAMSNVELTKNVLDKQDVMLYVNRNDTTTYIFNGLTNIPDSTHFKYGILIGGGAASNPGKVMIWHVFINTSETVFFTKIIGDDTMTLTGSISDGVLTITSSATIYGGLRLIWLG